MKLTKLLLAAVVVLLVLPVAAGEEGEAAGLSPEMMEAWNKVKTPNEHHQHLAKLAGKWTSQGKFWMTPEAPVMEASGTASNEMIMGGRFLQSSFDGDFMGERFLGMGIDGYDNALNKHIGMWIDSAGTMMMQFIGECSENGKILETTTEFLDPMSGQMKKMKGMVTVIDADTYTYESWNQGEDGEFFRSMEITYKRKS